MCEHSECQIADALALAESLAKMYQDLRMDSVRCILLAFTAPPGFSNNFNRFSVPGHNRKRISAGDMNCTTQYALRGGGWIIVS